MPPVLIFLEGRFVYSNLRDGFLRSMQQKRLNSYILNYSILMLIYIIFLMKKISKYASADIIERFVLVDNI